MVNRRLRSIIVTVAAMTAVNSGAPARAKETSQATRARPPKWSADILDAFFTDARQQLSGPRPAFDRTNGSAIAADNAASSSPPASAAAAGDGWSRLIDAETIETEIKRLAQSVVADVTTPGPFKGGGYKACRRNFSLLAVLFAADAEYDGPVRWKDVAAGLRDQFARAGYNCKVGTDQTYQEASTRKQDLADLISGARPRVPAAERTVETWSAVSDRPPLMQRLDAAQQERLTKWLANEREFKAHANEVRHEAQIAALIAGIIARKEFDYWDDEQFTEYAKELQAAAMDMAAAAEAANYQQAQQAVTRVTNACANCHDGYRG